MIFDRVIRFLLKKTGMIQHPFPIFCLAGVLFMLLTVWVFVPFFPFINIWMFLGKNISKKEYLKALISAPFMMLIVQNN